MTPEIHIDPDTVKIRGPLPKERPFNPHPNAVAVDNLCEAAECIEDDHWDLDDGDVGIRRADYNALVKAWRACEGSGK